MKQPIYKDIETISDKPAINRGYKKKKTIYTITIKNWEKYNSTKKKGHNCILLSTGFLTDAKIRTLPSGGRLLYLGLLLRCGEVCVSSIEASHDLLVTLAGGSGQVIDRLLSQLESLQLVTVAKSEVLLDRIEEKSKEKNRIEKKGEEKKEQPKKTSPKLKVCAPDGTQTAIAKYCELWKEKYKSQAPVRGKDAGLIKSLVNDFGVTKAMEFIEAYLQMPDSWFVTKRHDVSTLLGNLNSVSQFIDTGRMFTRKEINNLDQTNSTKNLIAMVERGEV